MLELAVEMNFRLVVIELTKMELSSRLSHLAQC